MARLGLTSHRKFLRLASGLNSVAAGFGGLIARGVLETLWDAAYTLGSDYLGDALDVELMAGWAGAPGALASLLESAGGEGRAGFIIRDQERGGFRIHDLWDHAPPWVKKRALRNAERESNGRTLSEIRAEAGRKGRAAAAGRAATSGEQMVAVCPANGQQTDAVCSNGQGQANGGQAKVEQTDAICQQTDAVCPAKTNVMEGNGGKGSNTYLSKTAGQAAQPPLRLVESTAPAPLPEVTEKDLLDAYLAYPRRKGKTPGLKIAAREIKTKAQLADLRRAIAAYAKEVEGRSDEYIAHFSTFMGKWRDYLDDDGPPVAEEYAGADPAEVAELKAEQERRAAYHASRHRMAMGEGREEDIEIFKQGRAEGFGDDDDDWLLDMTCREVAESKGERGT